MGASRKGKGPKQRERERERERETEGATERAREQALLGKSGKTDINDPVASKADCNGPVTDTVFEGYLAARLPRGTCCVSGSVRRAGKNTEHFAAT